MAVVGGTTTAYPEITITAPAGGLAGPIAITNVTRDETLTYTGSLGNAHKLRVRTDYSNQGVHKSTDGGTTWTDVIGSVDPGPFPALTAGVENSWSITGIDTATIDFNYRVRYA